MSELRLKSFVDRVLRLKEEQDALSADIREVYAEAKGEGYDKTAMGELVAYLRKVEKKGADAVAEKQTHFDLYLDAYERASGTVVATHAHAPDRSASYAEANGVDRQARAKQRMSESMDDHKALSAELAAYGLISEEAHAETSALSDAIARKFGNGVIATNSPETADEMDRSTKSPCAARSGEAEKGREAIPAEPEGADLNHAGADESSADDGRDVEAAGGAASVITNSNSLPTTQVADMADGVTPPALSATNSDDVPRFLTSRSHAEYRPNCQHPDVCAASGLDHCYSCRKAMSA